MNSLTFCFTCHFLTPNSLSHTHTHTLLQEASAGILMIFIDHLLSLHKCMAWATHTGRGREITDDVIHTMKRATHVHRGLGEMYVCTGMDIVEFRKLYYPWYMARGGGGGGGGGEGRMR